MEWIYIPFFSAGDQAFYNRYIQQQIDTLLTPGGVAPQNFATTKNWNSISRATHFFSMGATQAIEQSLLTGVWVENVIIQTRVACALEQYWLRHRCYPATLSELVPDFLPSLPMGAINNQTFRYRPESDGSFRLWSPGWNGTDEHGAWGISRGDYATHDWVWSRTPGDKPENPQQP